MTIQLFYPISAEFLAAAFFAVSAHPKRVELFDSGFNDLWVIREDSRFKIATEGAFHANASTCQICGADVGGF